MRTASQIKTLITVDILNTKLIGTLDAIGIDADLYLTDVSEVVFDLLDITEAKRTDQLYTTYIGLLKEIKEKVVKKEAVQEQAEKIYTELQKFR